MTTSASRQCFAHEHMSPAEYGLWTLGRELSYKKNILYFDGRHMAERFSRGGKTAMYRLMHGLIDSGWFVLLEPRKRKSNGQWSAYALRVLPHEEWVKIHGADGCKVEKNGAAPVPISECASPEIALQPVPPAGHSSGIPLQSSKNLQLGNNLVKPTSPEIRNGVRALSKVLACPLEPETEPLEQSICSASPASGTGPVLPAGLDGSDCPVPENPPASP